MQLFLIQLFGYDLTAIELTVGAAGLLYGIAKVFQAIRDIRTLGWQPFKEHWIAPRQARTEKLDKLIGTVDGLVGKVDGVEQKVDRIDGELRTNGGSTVKDMVCRIDTKVEHIQARVRHQDETNERAIFELDDKGHLTFANCAFRELVDAEESELLHFDFVSRIHREDRSRFMTEIGESIANKMPLDTNVRFRIMNIHATIDGSWRSVQLSAKPDVRTGGQLVRFFGTACKAAQ